MGHEQGFSLGRILAFHRPGEEFDEVGSEAERPLRAERPRSANHPEAKLPDVRRMAAFGKGCREPAQLGWGGTRQFHVSGNRLVF
jgi:hypothetical protein